MAKSTSDVEKEANKGIAQAINYFYTRQQIRPDATHFKSGYNMLKPLMFPSDQYAVYDINEIKSAIDVLIDNNIVLITLSILSWPNLVSAVVRGDTRSVNIIIKNIKEAQARDGIVSNDSIPKGW